MKSLTYDFETNGNDVTITCTVVTEVTELSKQYIVAHNSPDLKVGDNVTSVIEISMEHLLYSYLERNYAKGNETVKGLTYEHTNNEVSLLNLRRRIKMSMFIGSDPKNAEILFDLYKRRGGKLSSIEKICGEV